MNIFILIALVIVAGGIYLLKDCLKPEPYIPTELEDEKFFNSIDEAAQYLYDMIEEGIKRSKNRNRKNLKYHKSLEQLKEHLLKMTNNEPELISDFMLERYLSHHFDTFDNPESMELFLEKESRNTQLCKDDPERRWQI